jgi:hypothetical protein
VPYSEQQSLIQYALAKEIGGGRPSCMVAHSSPWYHQAETLGLHSTREPVIVKFYRLKYGQTGGKLWVRDSPRCLLKYLGNLFYVATNIPCDILIKSCIIQMHVAVSWYYDLQLVSTNRCPKSKRPLQLPSLALSSHMASRANSTILLLQGVA